MTRHVDYCAIMSGYQACTCPADLVEHRDGIAWADAPVPRRWHDCWGQTWTVVAGDHYRRCPCGSVSRNRGPWVYRNSRKRRRWWHR